MTTQDLIFKGCWALLALILLFYYLRRRRRLKSALFGMITGVAALAALHYYGDYIGYTPPFNAMTLSTSMILGIPGVAMMAMLQIL